MGQALGSEYNTGLNPITLVLQMKSWIRVFGCCAHIASVLWYLELERHKPAKEIYMTDEIYIDSLTDAAAEVLDTNSGKSKVKCIFLRNEFDFFLMCIRCKLHWVALHQMEVIQNEN